jgi:ubiquinone/menaquinone biosynthesis C-methylase UbiE/uncharacterized protein YbaR (Trm112 family)
MSTVSQPQSRSRSKSIDLIELLQCPVSHEALSPEDGALVAESTGERYRVTASGIPVMAEKFCSDDGRVQQQHYDRVAAAYIENLNYPHTQEYQKYLDGAMLEAAQPAGLGVVAEICCGRGEAFQLLRDKIVGGVGVDISLNMLEAARAEFDPQKFMFLQGDATMLPLRDASFDSVFMLGGIHHVNDRQALFNEIFRILKPGGYFIWREPVSDFFLWRFLRAIIYRLSPGLDHETERPLLHEETWPVLEKAGMQPQLWRTCGFFGFCLLMNSDILMFNRLFRFIPGIRAFTRFAAWLDERIVRLPGLKRAGLQVVGRAQRPTAATSARPSSQRNAA